MQDRCTVCTVRTIGSEIILDAPNVHLGDKAQLVARFSPFGDSVILTQDRCTVCTECTIGSEIILDAPNVHLGDEAQLVAHFGPFGDSVILMKIGAQFAPNEP